ncbi:quaternary amine ABC transporter ATP-binding protein [Atopomonas sediminilitoris]|uniref:quaternary amine ABC transporter ATP-binding protein n=1 Tax=Atopomonas sediminilitoris TaxID=2919919 RepID=UPI001F4EBF16|nr:glycine betaine/L-proline ABC transporter ATP-binding protein [Atopomonas sediminilitoris]MCJ8168264.1 glycine betaine/L-proline ABC transporter ATP-binding protein [Atopomonas sediminilitoris]
MSKIEVKGIYKLFGKQPQKWLAAAQSGMSKEALLKESGHTLGLRDISLNIEEGSIHVIMGLSGSGKSTLIRHFNRLIEPTAGKILVDGQDVTALSRRELELFRQQKMSMVFQRFGLFPHRSVLDNAAYGLKVQGVERALREEKAMYWLDQVGLKGFEKQFPHQLSGGMQQRVGLARALATDAEILLMDEAFSALDPLIRREMQDQLLALQEKLHKTIVFITHDLDEALRLGNRIAILKDGELVQEGTSEDILLRPATDYVAAFLQDVNRSKVLTAAHAIHGGIPRLAPNSTPAEAVSAMAEAKQDYSAVLADGKLQGVLTLAAAQQAASQNSAIDTQLVEVAQVKGHTPLEEILGDLLTNKQPAAVVDEDGQYRGMLARSKVAELLGAQVV